MNNTPFNPKKRKIDPGEVEYKESEPHHVQETEVQDHHNFLTHTALSFRESDEEELGSYVTDSSGIFLHKNKYIQAIINESMEVEFHLLRELNEEEIKVLEHRDDLFPKTIFKESKTT